jgi:hypothetical protein
MNPGDIRKLLGGYAAGTLTEEERRALFEAALTDQDLFNELAHEQALKELLEEPGARRQLLTALEEKPALIERFRAWLSRPVAWVAAGSLAVGALLVVVAVRRTEAPTELKPVLTAKLEAPSVPATPTRTLGTAKDREKGAIAAIAVPAAPPAPVRKARPEVPSEIATRQGIRADAVGQPPAAVEVQPGAVPEGSNRVRSSLREAEPGGVVGGAIGPSAAAPKAAPVQAEAVPLNQIAVVPTTQALEAARGGAKQALSLSAYTAAGAAADKKSDAAIAPPPIPYRILRAGADGKFAEAPAGTAFRPADRVRVVFSPRGRGRLVVWAADRTRLLLDRAVRQGAAVNLDVPALVSSLLATLTPQPEQSGVAGALPAAAPAAVTFSIAIPWEPAP